MTQNGGGLEELQDDYADAWLEWEASGEAAVWEGAAGDGLEA